jgi:hypothetical protein
MQASAPPPAPAAGPAAGNSALQSLALCAPLKRRLRKLDLSWTRLGWSDAKWWLLLAYSPQLATLCLQHTSG